MNRKEIEKQLFNITSDLLREKGYIAPVDVFIGLSGYRRSLRYSLREDGTERSSDQGTLGER